MSQTVPPNRVAFLVVEVAKTASRGRRVAVEFENPSYPTLLHALAQMATGHCGASGAAAAAWRVRGIALIPSNRSSSYER